MAFLLLALEDDWKEAMQFSTDRRESATSKEKARRGLRNLRLFAFPFGFIALLVLFQMATSGTYIPFVLETKVPAAIDRVTPSNSGDHVNPGNDSPLGSVKAQVKYGFLRGDFFPAAGDGTDPVYGWGSTDRTLDFPPGSTLSVGSGAVNHTQIPFTTYASNHYSSGSRSYETGQTSGDGPSAAPWNLAGSDDSPENPTFATDGGGVDLPVIPKGDSSAKETSPVPEPATMLLLGTGLVGLAAARRKFS